MTGMTQPHYIDREAVAEPSNETCQFDAGQPVSNLYKFDAEIAWLKEAARYFSNRPTGGEDAAHWSNVYNAENANKIASRLDALSRAPAPMEAVAWRVRTSCGEGGFIAETLSDSARASLFAGGYTVQALAVIPTQEAFEDQK